MKKITSIILSIAMCMSICPSQAGAQNQNLPWNRRRTLENENRKKDVLIDSLLQIVSELEQKLVEAEKEEEVLEKFYVNDGQIGKGLRPEDYTMDVTDSLLSFWYLLNKARANHEGEDYDMETVHFSSDVPDKVFIERLEAMNSYISLPYNESVRNNILRYADRMPTKMGQMLGLAKYYMPIFEEAFDRYGLPEDLKYMAVIESALNPTAISRAGAGGMWQFMRTTGRSYGLQIDTYVDERFDVEKAVDAAARYLKDAYGVFGDWNLAISSYNCGAGNVNKAIRRAGGKTDYWSIYSFLPRETRGYVPAFVGAMYAFKYYKEHGITPEECSLPAHVDTIHINKLTHFKQINELVGIPYETLKELNPQYIRDVIPGNERTYVLRIPYTYTKKYLEFEDSVYNYKKDEFFNPTIVEGSGSGTMTTTQSRVVYKVKKGDSLGKIALRYRVGVADIRKWNNLRSNTINIGQNLVIYQTVSVPKPVEPAKPAVTQVDSTKLNSSADSLSVLSQPDSLKAAADSTLSAAQNITEAADSSAAKPVAPAPVTYTVKQGDTLYKIAGRYPGVTINDIKKLNGIGDNIKIGQKIKIPVK